jgi:hypothetical protein
MCEFGVVAEHAMSRMVFVVLTLIWALPVKAGLVVNFDAGVVTGFTGITARLEEFSDNSISFKGTTINLREQNGQFMAS